MKTINEILINNKIKVRYEGDDGFGGYINLPTGHFVTFMFSYSGGWEHLSISKPTQTPSWDDMCAAKNMFWDEDECCVEYHPAKKDYVNLHPYCLHIWKPINETLPTPPKNYV